MPQRVNIDYSAFSNAQSQLNSFFNKDLLISRSKINREAEEQAAKDKKKKEIIDAGLLIASMFVAPGASAVSEANTIAAAGAKEVGSKAVASQIVTNPLKKGFFTAANRSAYGKEFAKGALRKNAPSDMLLFL